MTDQDTRLHKAVCQVPRCGWITRGSKRWCDGQAKRHRADHATRAAERVRKAQARLEWKGRPNPTQRQLLADVAAGRVFGYQQHVYLAGGGEVTHWVPSGLTGHRRVWFPPMIAAGLVRGQRLLGPGAVECVWVLTDTGRHVLGQIAE